MREKSERAREYSHNISLRMIKYTGFLTVMFKYPKNLRSHIRDRGGRGKI